MAFSFPEFLTLAKIDWESSLLLWLGPVFFLFGLGLFIRTKWIKARYRKAKGVVVRYDEEWDNGSLMYYPVVNFTDHQNNDITFTSNVGLSFKNYNEGALVSLFFHPENPEKAEINSVVALYLLPIIFMIIGLVLCAIFIIPELLNLS